MLKKALNFLLASVIITTSADASIQIQATRVPFDAQAKEQTLRINNTGSKPALVQVWLSSTDKGDGQIKEELPFFINPPVARINAQKGKTFRIFQTEGALSKYPKDRETLLWLNALDIPPEAEDLKDANQLKIAFRTMIKFFYRPAGLKGNPIKAAEELKWKLQKTAKGYDVICINDSPFHVSMTNVWLTDASGKDIATSGEMVKPFDKLTYHFNSVSSIKGTGTLKYNFITDLGAYIKHTREL